ncbi:MAG: AEC family transporter [Lachnospiraceae bacterium]|nr:AEC family transporter [Lachnospiraceae bacterium]
MENFLIALNAVMPIFIMISYGYILNRIKVLNETGVKALNTIVFKGFFPILIFKNIYKIHISELLNIKLLSFAIVFEIILLVIVIAVVPHFVKDNSKGGVVAQSIFRSNFVLFGLALAASVYGPDNIGSASMVVAIMVPLFYVFSITTLETFRGGSFNPRTIAINVLKNPIIWGAIIGLIVCIAGITLPSFLQSVVSDFGSAANPLALLAMGGTMRFSISRENGQLLSASLLLRLIIVPLIGVVLGVLLGFRDLELFTIMVMTAAPVAVSSYTLAQQMGGDGELASQLVVFSTVFSLATIFCWIFVLKTIGLI